MNRSLLALVVCLSLVAGQPRSVQAEGLAAAPGDEDVHILDQHFALHLGGSIGALSFSVGAVVIGVQSLVGAREETSTRAAQSRFILGLTLFSMGVGTVVSASTGISRSVASWRSTRDQLLAASPAQRRLLRAREIKRLRAMARNRAIGLIADGAFLAIGIVLMAVDATDLGMPLVLDGSLVLGTDIFRLVVDDQFAARWEAQDLDSEAGYFSALPVPLPIPLPVMLPPAQPGAAPGAGLVIAGLF